MNLEEIELDELLETDDVAQKRYLMFKVFDQVLEEFTDEETDDSDRISALNGVNGYMYKQAQDFLTSSSTLEKREKLDNMLDYID